MGLFVSWLISTWTKKPWAEIFILSFLNNPISYLIEEFPMWSIFKPARILSGNDISSKYLHPVSAVTKISFEHFKLIYF